MNTGLPGVIAPIVTPYTPELEVDVEGVASLSSMLAKEGIGVLVAGTTGEMPLLLMDEKQKLVEAARRSVQGRVPVIAGSGGPNPYGVLVEASLLVGAGADYLLIPPPYYYKPPQYSIEAYYKWLSSNIGKPVLVYNIPSHTGYNISVDTLEEIVNIDNIVGVKATVESVDYQASLIWRLKSLNSDFLVYSGLGTLLLYNLASGGDGGVIAAANIAPKLYSQLYAAFKEGDYREALKLHKLTIKIPWILSPARSLQGGIKTILVADGILSNDLVRPPLPLEDDESRKRVLERWRESGLRDYL